MPGKTIIVPRLNNCTIEWYARSLLFLGATASEYVLELMSGHHHIVKYSNRVWESLPLTAEWKWKCLHGNCGCSVVQDCLMTHNPADISRIRFLYTFGHYSVKIWMYVFTMHNHDPYGSLILTWAPALL